MPERDQWEGHEGPAVDAVGEFTVIECHSCGFKHVIPIPHPDDLDETYRGDYYTVEKPLYLERSREDQQWWDTAYSDRYDTFERLLSSGRRRLLDVGSGPGLFLAHGRKRGWDVLGIEPSRQAAAHTREMGLVVVEEFLCDETVATLGSFDVVHASEVLEHVPDPAGLLRICHQMLEPGGIICLAVPNEYNALQDVLRAVCEYEPWWVAPPHHINYFDRESLSGLLEQVGFEVRLCESTFPMEMFLLMGERYVGNDEVGRECHRRRMLFEHNLVEGGMNDLKRELYGSLAALGIGREVIIYATKR